MPKIRDIFGVIEEVVDSQNKIKGKGIDVIELLNPDLKNKADVAIGPMLFKKPEGGSDLGGFATAKLKDDLTGTLAATKDKQALTLEKRYGEDDYLFGSVSKDPSGKSFFLGAKKRFKDGGAVQIGKGKDYIKDLI